MSSLKEPELGEHIIRHVKTSLYNILMLNRDFDRHEYQVSSKVLTEFCSLHFHTNHAGHIYNVPVAGQDVSVLTKFSEGFISMYRILPLDISYI